MLYHHNQLLSKNLLWNAIFRILNFYNSEEKKTNSNIKALPQIKRRGKIRILNLKIKEKSQSVDVEFLNMIVALAILKTMQQSDVLVDFGQLRIKLIIVSLFTVKDV